ncbi:aldo/keto reductase [Pseudobacteroides cellulosolvens]|uniref:NADP-dependent oxidoreductase domain containing protein n=1 Tax=Pseudobacteroides cellulosolvens ATCC 35603 = DSM 2933 TaxID=398512 RepID=A0A0L6JJR7_9FIRM|nr:aldo/keto reductase [Pseudobacteroides cellulosolvens]KNY25985.1 NADP-dependent oxidoreductase domain containing protein [Pseudobacteroides cellulosolvens ATCC 35603 = DSM 2933]
MRYRDLGVTGLKVSEISFGTIPILSGNVPVLPDYFSPDEETAITVMEHAYNLGCTLFDTAIVPEYGDAEIKLGKFASHIGRERIIISDKARFFYGNEMYNAVYESCRNLGTYADIYFVHQVDEGNEDLTFGKYGAVDALNDLKAEGKIKFAGIASHYYDILLRGAKDKRVDVLQGSGNILERGMLDRIGNEPLFKEKGLMINKVYAAGILPSFFPIDTLLSAVLSYPVSTALIGIGTIDQVEKAMLNEPHSFDIPTFSQVMSVLEKSFMPIPCHRCQRCRCKFGTEIHIIFRQYNYYFLGKDYWALRKLDMGISESAMHCKKCTDMSCMKQCPQGINIPHTVQMIKQLVDIHIRNSLI